MRKEAVAKTASFHVVNSFQPRLISSGSAAVPFSTREMAAATGTIVAGSSGADARVGRHGADVGFGAVLRGRGPARDHLADASQSVPHPVGVQQDEDRPVSPRQRFELFEGRVARGAHLAFVADLRLPDIARIAVRQPSTHRLPPFGCGGGRSGAASGTAGRRRVARRFRGTTTAPLRR